LDLFRGPELERVYQLSPIKICGVSNLGSLGATDDELDEDDVEVPAAGGDGDKVGDLQQLTPQLFALPGDLSSPLLR
jgi:hypothetical protein